MPPIVNMPEDMSNMHKNLVKIARGFGDILADRQTHRQTCSSQYFAATLTGEVISYIRFPFH